LKQEKESCGGLATEDQRVTSTMSQLKERKSGWRINVRHLPEVGSQEN